MHGGNGDYVEYTYDKLDRVSYKKYNGTNLGFWGYYANGQVGYFYDYASGKIYYFFYDGIGRFINADTYTTTDADGLLSTNMFAYCENNPVMGSDPTGEWVHLAVGAIVGGIMGGISASNSGGNVLTGIITGALGGVLAASGAGIVAQTAGSAALAAINSTTNQLLSKPLSEFNIREVGEDALIGAVSGAIGGKGASYGNAKSIIASGKKVAKQIGRNIKHGKSIIKPIKNYFKRAHNGDENFVLSELCKSISRSTVAFHIGSHRPR